METPLDPSVIETGHTGRLVSVEDPRVQTLVAQLMHAEIESLHHVLPTELAFEVVKTAAWCPGILEAHDDRNLHDIAQLIDVNAAQTGVHAEPGDPDDD